MNSLLLRQVGVYVFVTLIAHFLVGWVVGRMWSSVGVTKDDENTARPHAWTAKTVGLVERGLYVACLQLDKPEFIGIWLGIKVAGSWKSWTHGIKIDTDRTVEGRTVFAIFLVGNAMSVAYAVFGWKAIEWPVEQTVIVGIALLLATIILWFIAFYYGKCGRS